MTHPTDFQPSAPAPSQTTSSSLPKGRRAGDASQGATVLEALARARHVHLFEDVRLALRASQTLPYAWNIREDHLSWGVLPSEALGIGALDDLASGKGLSARLAPQGASERRRLFAEPAAVDEGTGVPFSLRYHLLPPGEEDPDPIALEESGVWYGDSQGVPIQVYGTLRRVSSLTHDKCEQENSAKDALTGLVTRSQMGHVITEVLHRERERGGSCAFLLVSISNLEVINDAYGFDITDQVISTVASRLKEVVRAQDVICRYSGSKFGLILSKCSHEDMKIAAERFLSIARENVIETTSGYVWAMLSIGGVLMPQFADTPHLAMSCAEEALVTATHKTYDCFVAFEPSVERISLRTLNARCASEVISSLEEDRLTLAYQPIVSALDGMPAFHEALLRMSCGEDETIDAIHLIPISEKLGLVRLVDRKVFSLALDALRRHPTAVLSVNISGVTATDPRWYRQLVETLSEAQDVCTRLIVEITETAAFHDLEDIERFIGELRVLGCRIAIDDFGAGYTSFRNLKLLNVDMVKIDGSFCEYLDENKDNQYFVRSLIDLARKFDLKTVAEWVQRGADAELLRAWGVDYLQGHLFGRAHTEEPWPLLAENASASHHFGISIPKRMKPRLVKSAEKEDRPSPEDLFADSSKLDAAKAFLDTLGKDRSV